ncbi:MAG TPA: nucleoside hydrolase-like domain-containing protein, partial [Verrucomicrobium sp.]|nr:nucleoside hydrolase-like domain-containing protein [Verrucomicrobium sp.]
MRLGQVTLHLRHVTHLGLAVWLLNSGGPLLAQNLDSRPRILVETDAGGDPDDEQSLVRLLMYANDFDIEGIIANREHAREGENKNPVRDGLGIVRAMVRAYGQCLPRLHLHDARYPAADLLLSRTVAGYAQMEDGVNIIIAAVDKEDRRPIWFSNWGTDRGSAESCLKRALDKVLRERGPEGYAKFKNRLRLSSADRFAEHTSEIKPPFRRWVDTSAPELEGKRWYHQFSRITAQAGGFDIQRDVVQNHGPLGALYPTNTGLPQKEGDTLMLLYLVPNGLSDPNEPTWGGWGGRLGINKGAHPTRAYYWANQADEWQGTTHRDNTLARWAADLQNDFRARMDWCVADSYGKANHAPLAVLNGDDSKRVLQQVVRPKQKVTLTSTGTRDPDGHLFTTSWMVYPEAGTYQGSVELTATEGETTSLVAPGLKPGETVSIHVILRVADQGEPPLCAYRRAVIVVSGPRPAPEAASVFPKADWEVSTPEVQGLEPKGLEEAVQFLDASVGADGAGELMIVRHGRVVWKGTNVDKVHGTWSLTKTFTSTALGLLIDDGRCTLDTPVSKVLPEMRTRFPGLKLRNFATMTSGYRAEGDETTGNYKHGPSKTPFVPGEPLFTPPGSQYAYWDSAMNQFGHGLTVLAKRPLADLFK